MLIQSGRTKGSRSRVKVVEKRCTKTGSRMKISTKDAFVTAEIEGDNRLRDPPSS